MTLLYVGIAIVVTAAVMLALFAYYLTGGFFPEPPKYQEKDDHDA